MLRRQFISLIGFGTSMAAIGLPAICLAKTSAEVSQSGTMPRPLFVGLGGGGNNMLDAFLAQFENTPVSNQAQDYVSVAINNKGETNRRSLSLDEEQIAGMLARAMEPNLTGAISQVVIFAGLGGLTGGDMISRVASRYCASGVTVTAVVTQPFGFEGAQRRIQADRQLQALQEIGCSVRCRANDVALKSMPGNTSLLNCFQAINRWATREAIAAAWPALV